MAADPSTEDYEENANQCITRVLRCLRDSWVDVSIEKMKFDYGQLASVEEGGTITVTEIGKPDLHPSRD